MATLARASIQLENPSVGGRNYARGTSGDWSTPYTKFSGVENICPSIGRVYTTGWEVGDILTVRIYIKYAGLVAAAGKTIRAWLQGSGNVTAWASGAFGSSSQYQLSGSGEIECKYTMTATEARLQNSFFSVNFRTDWIESGSIQWKGFKVEKGTMATDWTPAPEDIDEAISDLSDQTIANAQEMERRLSTQIVQSQEQITQTVSEQYFTKDETNRLIQEISTAFTQTAEGWQMDFNKLIAVVNANQAENDQEFEAISKYIRFVDGNIILGQVQNPIILTIKNDRVSFSQSGQEVAYLSNSELVITDARITHSLRIGNFGWIPRANGSLDLKKVS